MPRICTREASPSFYCLSFCVSFRKDSLLSPTGEWAIDHVLVLLPLPSEKIGSGLGKMDPSGSFFWKVGIGCRDSSLCWISEWKKWESIVRAGEIAREKERQSGKSTMCFWRDTGFSLWLASSSYQFSWSLIFLSVLGIYWIFL